MTENTVDSARDLFRNFYLGITLAISFCAFFGFSFTYFRPIFAARYPEVAPIVHLHGWTFFLWYLLFPLQAGLIGRKNYKQHMALGRASLALAVVMVFSGMVVISARVSKSFEFVEPTYWSIHGIQILSTLVLFGYFYTRGFLNRGQGELHKRFMVLASVSALGAAMFRILMGLLGPVEYATWAGILLTNIFILVGMAWDYKVLGRIHPVYIKGLAIILTLEGGSMLLGGTDEIIYVNQVIAWFFGILHPFY